MQILKFCSCNDFRFQMKSSECKDRSILHETVETTVSEPQSGYRHELTSIEISPIEVQQDFPQNVEENVQQDIQTVTSNLLSMFM